MGLEKGKGQWRRPQQSGPRAPLRRTALDRSPALAARGGYVCLGKKSQETTHGASGGNELFLKAFCRVAQSVRGSAFSSGHDPSGVLGLGSLLSEDLLLLLPLPWPIQQHTHSLSLPSNKIFHNK